MVIAAIVIIVFLLSLVLLWSLVKTASHADKKMERLFSVDHGEKEK